MMKYKARKRSSDPKVTSDRLTSSPASSTATTTNITSRPTSLSVALAAKSCDLRHLRRALRDPRCHSSVSPCHQVRMKGDRVTTALHLCCHPERKETLSALCRYVGADRMDVNVRDWMGNSALHHAVVCNNAVALMALAQQPGADLCAVNKEGKTPLILALDLYRKVVVAGEKETSNAKAKKKNPAEDLWQCIQFLMSVPKTKTDRDRDHDAAASRRVTPSAKQSYEQSEKSYLTSRPRSDRNNNTVTSNRAKVSSLNKSGLSSKRARSPIRAPSPATASRVNLHSLPVSKKVQLPACDSSRPIIDNAAPYSRSIRSQERVSNWLNNVSLVEVFEVEDDDE